MNISRPELLGRDGSLQYRARVRSRRGDTALWYCLNDAHANLVSTLSDAPLLALLIPAMARGEDVYVEGAVSERLSYNLSGPYQHVLRTIIPQLQAVRVDAEEIVRAPNAAGGVATGFSAGIDSFCVLADHHYGSAAPGFRLTHLLFHNVGSHGETDPDAAEQLFLDRSGRARATAARIGLPFVAVNSNLDSFYDEGMDFFMTHTLRNASVALLLQEGIGRYLYASAYQYGDLFVGPSDSISYSEPISLNMVSTDACDMISHGSEYSRVEKTLRVAEMEDSYDTLDVCVRKQVGGNCSCCWKCLRTLLTLEVSGLTERYASVFDLAVYRKHRTPFITKVLRSNDPLLREIAQFAQQRDFRFPTSARFHAISRVGRAFHSARRVGRTLKQIGFARAEQGGEGDGRHVTDAAGPYLVRAAAHYAPARESPSP